MSPKIAMKERPEASGEVLDILSGLLRPHACLSPKYFYDSLGSKLFEAITELDEYDLARTEAAIFVRHARDIAAAAGQGGMVVDLGAGNCEKFAALYETLRPDHYVPIDISGPFLEQAAAKIRAALPALHVTPIAADFSETLPALPEGGTKMFFYPGSSLGNFPPLAAAQFLRRIAAAGGALLLGIDLGGDAARLHAAYNDALGVTAAFNLNILRNVNRLAGTDFDLAQWRHIAFFNAPQSRIEMHLKSVTDVTVSWPGGARHFPAGSQILTEYSYKYTRPAICAMLREAGFAPPSIWTDGAQRYAVLHAHAR